ncbi:MAG TPA: histidine kinase [Candidatus Didemnitutus sp.]|nr:histidine kinase [Candidatus Didemnitutus sp.]
MATPAPVSVQRNRRLRDAAIRTVGIPLFGLAIPRLTGALGDLTARQPLYWVGTGWFLLLSFVLWMGNRAILYWLRERDDWLDRPFRKVTLLLGTTVAYSSAIAFLAMLSWYSIDARPGINWPGLWLNVGVILPVVFLVTHLYETLFLINDRLEDRFDREHMERVRLQAELTALKSQLTPHFLFNSLHTLGVLIEESPATARTFNRHLATVCRYLLAQVKRELVALDEELAFFRAYTDLARLRFPDSVRVRLEGFTEFGHDLLIPPASLQLLMENALKHNVVSPDAPMVVTLSLAGRRLSFVNTLRREPPRGESTGVGLRNLRERYLITVGEPIVVESNDVEFRVTLPLLHRASERLSSSSALRSTKPVES